MLIVTVCFRSFSNCDEFLFISTSVFLGICFFSQESASMLGECSIIIRSLPGFFSLNEWNILNEIFICF